MNDKEITIEFSDGRKATIVKIEDLNTDKFIKELSEINLKILEENKKLKNIFKKLEENIKEDIFKAE